MKRAARNTGFTLVELLVVVGLIGILSGVALGLLNVSGIRSKTRDAQRVSDLKKIQVALALYHADNRIYPISSSWIHLSGTSTLETTLETGSYINVFPHDPEEVSTNSSPCSNYSGNRYNYRTSSTGTNYILTAMMDISSSNDGHECESLRNWSSIAGCSSPLETTDYCYGTENP